MLPQATALHSGSIPEPRDPSVLTDGLIQLLLTRPSVDELAQYLVLTGLPSLKPWQAAIYAVDSTGRLRLMGAFGRESAKGDLDGKFGMDAPLVSDLLRWRMAQTNLATPAPEEISGDGGADASPHGPELVWPLMTPSRVSGVLQTRFSGMTISDAAEAELAALSPILSLVLEFLAVSEESPGNGHPRYVGAWSNIHQAEPSANSGHPQHASADWRRGVERGRPRALSVRQQKVLEFMAQGMTNGQIARALKFSESTVRQETMAIYRFLQVPGRVEAVDAAIARGLLPQPDPAATPAVR
jgi:DNA-binding NarL/FixJ family response regulator